MNQKQSWEETLEKIIRGILSRYEDKFDFDFKAAERSWGKKAGMEKFLREEFSIAIKQAIQTREREISKEVRGKADAEIRATIHPVFHPTFSDGVNSGRIAAFTEVLSIINNKSL